MNGYYSEVLKLHLTTCVAGGQARRTRRSAESLSPASARTGSGEGQEQSLRGFLPYLCVSVFIPFDYAQGTASLSTSSAVSFSNFEIFVENSRLPDHWYSD